MRFILFTITLLTTTVAYAQLTGLTQGSRGLSASEVATQINDSLSTINNLSIAGDMTVLGKNVYGDNTTPNLLLDSGNGAKIRFGNDEVSVSSNLIAFNIDSELARFNIDNFLLGGTADDATAKGVFYIYNGTAPAAGKADASSIYARDVTASSEMHVMDEAGNETQISPHDPESGKWIFYSKNVHTGRVLRIEMEELMFDLAKEMSAKTGKTYIYESDSLSLD